MNPNDQSHLDNEAVEDSLVDFPNHGKQDQDDSVKQNSEDSLAECPNVDGTDDDRIRSDSHDDADIQYDSSDRTLSSAKILNTAPFLSESLSGINNVADSCFYSTTTHREMNHRSASDRLPKFYTERSTKPIPTSYEKPEAKLSIIGCSPNHQSEGNKILDTAAEEADIKLELDQIVSQYEKNFYQEIVPTFKQEILGYEAEYQEAVRDCAPRDKKEPKEFFQSRKESANKIFLTLENDLKNKIQEIRKGIEESDKLTNEFLKSKSNELEILTKRLLARLTVYSKKEQIVTSLRHKRLTIVVGAPGCGKSTQIPQLILTEKLLTDNKRKVFMVSPRMAAARKVCERINQELGEERCEFHSGEKACIELAQINFAVDYEFYRRLVVTKEINLEELEYLIIDEANSKKMHTEVILSMSRKLMRSYKHLKLVVLSTSLNKYEIQNFFRSYPDLEIEDDDAIEISDCNFRTETIYMNLNGSTEEKINQVLISIEVKILEQLKSLKVSSESKHSKFVNQQKLKNPNILMFLKGASEVKTMYQRFNEWLTDKPGLISLSEELKALGVKANYKLFMASGASDMVLDNEILMPNETTVDKTESVKLIFSTKVLETSLTIPNLGYVVDFGEEHIYAFDHKMGVEMLREQKISRDTAIQRRGRVGRTCKGVCYRLYKEEDLTEEHSLSELAYKKLDGLVLSWILISLDFRRSKENLYFDMKPATADLDNSQQEEASSEDVIKTLSKLMGRFELTSEIEERSIQKSLSLMKDLSIIGKDTLTKGVGDVFKVVLASGTDLCFAKTIYRAILECGGAKDLKDGNSKVPWLLEEVITMVACNIYNRRITTEKLNTDFDQKLRGLMIKYGDFAHNYEIYRLYDKRSTELGELQAQKSILRGFANNAHMIRSRIQKLLQLPNGFFRTIRQQFDQKLNDDERYRLLTECLAVGYAPDISMHIGNKIGYYNYRTKQIVQFANQSANKSTMTGEMPKFMVISDIIMQHSKFISRFCFKVDKQLLQRNFTKIIKSLEGLDMATIPTKIYERTGLSSEMLHNLTFRDFILKQVLDKKDGTILSLSERALDLRIVLPENTEELTRKRLDALIKHFDDNLNNHTIELFLEGCRANVGQGLRITDIITYRETSSFYHFFVPRFIRDNCEVMFSGETLSSGPGKIGNWDFLLFDYKKFFEIQDIDTKCETTVSKVNYNAGPQMNLKLTCKTLKDMESVREKIKKKNAEVFNYSNVPNMKKSEVKFFDKQTYSSEIGNMMKPIIMGVFLFTKTNIGSCTIRGIVSLEVKTVVALLESQRHSNSIFGDKLRVEVTKETIEISGLPPQLDEMSIEKFLKSHRGIIKNSDISIKMYKKAASDMNYNPENLDRYKEILEDLIVKMIEQKQKTLNPEERFSSEFVCRRSSIRQTKRFDCMIEIEVRSTSYELVELIQEKLNGKYYPYMDALDGQESYKLGLAYTHVEVYDIPEFYCRKSSFIHFKKFIDDLNTSIQQSINTQFPVEGQGKGEREANKRAMTKVEYPEEDWLNSLKPDENVKICIRKGAERSIAEKVEGILTNYFRGQEFHIETEQYSFWFGGEGKKFLQELKGSHQAATEYALINQEIFRSLIVLKCFSNVITQKENPNSIQNQIKDKIESLKLRRKGSLFIKATLREIEMLQKNAEFKSLTKDLQPGTTIATYTNHGGLIVIETDSQKEIEAIQNDIIKILTKIRDGETDLSEFEKVVCHMCNERGIIQRLHLCKHNYCYLCLQKTIFRALDNATKEVEADAAPTMNKPYVFCSKKGCYQPIATCDIFKVLSENMVTVRMRGIVKKVLENKMNIPDLMKCSGCGTYNRKSLNMKQKVCFGCNKQLTLTK